MITRRGGRFHRSDSCTVRSARWRACRLWCGQLQTGRVGQVIGLVKCKQRLSCQVRWRHHLIEVIAMPRLSVARQPCHFRVGSARCASPKLSVLEARCVTRGTHAGMVLRWWQESSGKDRAAAVVTRVRGRSRQRRHVVRWAGLD